MSKDWLLAPAKEILPGDLEKARAYQTTLTKPPGSLGMLEDIAVQFCAWQQSNKPKCDKVQIAIFAADHGICAQGVSAFPQAVTAQMVMNFVMGGAAISVLAKQIDAEFKVINVGLLSEVDDHEALVNSSVKAGTNDFTQEPAMSADELLNALEVGRQQVDKNASLFIGGDMGIGNTTSASAIYSVLLKLAPEQTVGPGTGVDKHGIENKRKALYQAFNLHGEQLNTPLSTLQHVGGLEIAALVGSYIASAQAGMPILIDGFITTAAALLAVKINPRVRDWMIFAHTSAEPAHRLALEYLDAKPILDFGMRLGEGSGAGVAVPLIRSALALHTQMATFDSAGVSEA